MRQSAVQRISLTRIMAAVVCDSERANCITLNDFGRPTNKKDAAESISKRILIKLVQLSSTAPS